jgi:hypothetical protein
VAPGVGPAGVADGWAPSPPGSLPAVPGAVVVVVVVVGGGGGPDPPAVAWTMARSVSVPNRTAPAEAIGAVPTESALEKLMLALTPSKAVMVALVAPGELTVVLA